MFVLARVRGLFFNPTADRGPGDAEGPFQTSQGGAFFIRPQNEGLFCFAVARRCGVVPAGPPTIVALVALLAVAGQAIANQPFTRTVTAMDTDRLLYHRLTA